MINNQEKIDIIINRINNIENLIKSFTDNAEICKDKYSLEKEILACNARKSVLLEVLNDLEGSI